MAINDEELGLANLPKGSTGGGESGGSTSTDSQDNNSNDENQPKSTVSDDSTSLDDKLNEKSRELSSKINKLSGDLDLLEATGQKDSAAYKSVLKELKATELKLSQINKSKNDNKDGNILSGSQTKVIKDLIDESGLDSSQFLGIDPLPPMLSNLQDSSTNSLSELDNLLNIPNGGSQSSPLSPLDPNLTNIDSNFVGPPSPDGLNNPSKLGELGNKTSNDFDDSAEETKRVPDVEETYRKGNLNESLFSGIENKIVGDVDQFTAARLKYYESTNKTKGFLLPWDGRLGQSYTSSQSIGNHMPYGTEWVGSPSIANPYALIRFEHIAGVNHHKDLLDQEGNAKFRSGLLQPYAKATDFEGRKVQTDDASNTSIIELEKDEKLNMGVMPGEQVIVDDRGALYVNEVDFGTQIWEPSKEPVVDGELVKKSALPTQIVVEDSNFGSQKEKERLNSLKSERGEKPSENIESGTSSFNASTPNKSEYWLEQEGLVQCTNPISGNVDWVPRSVCINGQVSQETAIPRSKFPVGSEGDEQYKAAIAAKKEELLRPLKNVRRQVQRGWKLKKNVTKRRYLRNPSNTSVPMEPLEPTTDNLCNIDNNVGREHFPYRWSDFLYCKHYNHIPNNYLVTLRRYPMPAYDNGKIFGQDTTNEHILPMAQAVTWLGDKTGNNISDILGFTAKLNWRDLESQVNTVTGNEQGNEDGPFSNVAKWLGILSGESDFESASGWDEQRAKFDPYSDGMYSNRIYGPVNAVTKTKARDRGIEFENSINLNFHYILRSIGGENPKAAMLDILANFLALTYNNADFWGGANRYFPNKPAYPFLGSKKGMQAWYNGDITGFIDGLGDQLVDTIGNLGDMIGELLSNPTEAIKKLAGGAAKAYMADKQKDKRPAILNFKALLTGDPVGEWHLTVGNPYNPIATMGNMIVTGCNVTFSEELGVDDFPEEMTVTVTLEHGRPRDKGDIESIFNRGGGRMHYAPFGTGNEVWNNAAATKSSVIDSSYKKDNKKDIKTNRGYKYTGYEERYPAKDTEGFNLYSGRPEDFNEGKIFASGRKVYDGSSKQAFSLAEKVGFKSNSEV